MTLAVLYLRVLWLTQHGVQMEFVKWVHQTYVKVLPTNSKCMKSVKKSHEASLVHSRRGSFLDIDPRVLSPASRRPAKFCQLQLKSHWRVSPFYEPFIPRE